MNAQWALRMYIIQTELQYTFLQDYIRTVENQLIEQLGTKVKLRPGKKGGSIEG